MNSSQPQIHSLLHQQALKIAKELRTQEFLMIEILQKIDEAKTFRTLGFKSLFQYASLGLGLPDERAYNFILVSRKARQIDKLQEALKSQSITLSKAKRISSVINNENADQWLNLSRSLSQRSLERAVAQVNPKAKVYEGTSFISESLLELKAVVSVETEQLLKRVEDLLCQSKGRAVSKDEALKAMAKIFLHQKDPVEKAKRVMAKRVKKVMVKGTKKEVQTEIYKSLRLVNHQPSTAQRLINMKFRGNWSLRPVKREPIPAALKHQIYLRDRGRCQAQDIDKKTCEQSRWIDLHHRQPISQGGLTTIENLVTLCKAHHQMEHENPIWRMA